MFDGVVLGSHRIRSPVAGKLFGHNSAVVQEPSIITSDPRLRGYIGMVMLNGWEADILKANLANATEYVQCVCADALWRERARTRFVHHQYFSFEQR